MPLWHYDTMISICGSFCWCVGEQATNACCCVAGIATHFVIRPLGAIGTLYDAQRSGLSCGLEVLFLLAFCCLYTLMKVVRMFESWISLIRQGQSGVETRHAKRSIACGCAIAFITNCAESGPKARSRLWNGLFLNTWTGWHSCGLKKNW